jgi:hypothetical protein
MAAVTGTFFAGAAGLVTEADAGFVFLGDFDCPIPIVGNIPATAETPTHNHVLFINS